MKGPKHSLPLIIAAAVLIVGFLALKSWGITRYLNGVLIETSASPNSARTEDIFLPRPSARGSALVLHGLNFDAEGMRPLGEVVNQEGFEVFIPRLAAHRGSVEETLENPTEKWRKQFSDWQMRMRPPEVCVGYSMGGLLLLERYLTGHYNCGKFILFAPALAIHMPAFVSNWLELLIPTWLKFPSAIPPAYRHFDNFGMGPTFAVTKLMQQIRGVLPERNVKKLPPGLVFLDPRDEVVNATKVTELVKTHFPEWRVLPLNALDLNENHAFHLIVDEPHLGASQWQRVLSAIQDFI